MAREQEDKMSIGDPRDMMQGPLSPFIIPESLKAQIIDIIRQVFGEGIEIEMKLSVRRPEKGEVPKC